MELPYLKRQKQHAIGKAGRASEKRLAKEASKKLSRKVTRPASGAIPGFKGDLDLGEVLMEAKSTTADSMTLKLVWLMKISQEALSEGKKPALMVSFVKADGRPWPNGEWVMIPRREFDEMFNTVDAGEKEKAG